MNKITCLLLAVIIITLFSCESNQKVNAYLEQFQIEQLETEKIEFDSLLTTAMDIYIIDSMLMINEFRRSGHLISFWDKNSAKLIARRIPVGKGPGEYLPPLYLEYFNDTLGVFNRNDYQYRTYVLDSLLNPVLLTQSAMFPEYPTWIRRISDSVFIGHQRVSYLNQEEKQPERFSILNDSGALLHDINVPYPEIQSNIELNPRLQSVVFQGSRTLKPDKSKLAIASVDLGNVEVFNISPNNIEKIYENQVDKNVLIGEYSDNSTRFVRFQDEQVRGYASMFTSNNYFYVLYAGESAAMSRRKGYRFILQYDWDGNPVKGYELDTPVVCFTIDEKAGLIYGITYDYDKLVKAKI